MFSAVKSTRLITKLFSNQFSSTFYKNVSSSYYSTKTASNPVSKRPEEVRKVTMIPGDGIGPELMFAVKEVFLAANVPVEFEEFWISEVHDRCDDDLINKLIDSIVRNKVALKGQIATPIWFDVGDLQSVNMNIRKKLDLFANVVRVQSVAGVKTRHNNLDVVVIREQLEGEYSSLEHEVIPGVVESLKIVTRKKSERIAKFAFDYATKNKRKKITAVHKANIQKLADGMFLDTCRRVSLLYPKIEFNSMIVDNACMQLTSNPQQFDVMVMPNLYGNIIDNLCVGLVGGAGIVPGESYSNQSVVFETGARHSFAHAVGRNIANPSATLLCAANLLNHINLRNHGDLIRNSVLDVIKEQKVRTNDLGGYATTTEFTSAVISKLGRFDKLI